ncbi:MAG: hypothetical protein CEE38_12560 [Planctomycetes bacterium B3_Pla]|nr:MAG: hypothetical protein CEE38_12560 [Planctomycetes bacterium B3_Pla]
MSKKSILLTSLVLLPGLIGSASAQEVKGEILVEWWLNSSGNAVANIRSHPGFPDDPDGSARLDTFEVPRSKPPEMSVLNDNYGARVIGFLYPPEDGVYTFWITGDNGSEFLLSTDDDPANATAICQVPGTEWTGDREWDKFPTDQKSNPVTLIGGKKYYVEAIYQEGGGGDGVAIGWGGPTIGAGPMIIDGQYLSPMIRPSDFLADDPVPADAAVVGDTWVNMEWSAGYKAASHDVYFGDNFDDVYAGTGETFQGNQATAFFVVGFPGFPYPEGLVVGTTYYWRVDEKEADGTTHKGDVWSFLVPPVKAYNPSPSDDARFVQTDVALGWEAGFGAKLHTVYFGDNFDDVSNAAAGAPVGTTTFDPGPLEFNKTYYWRIDELDPPFTHTGNVWAFTTTLPGLGTAVMDRWENMGDTDINVLKDSPKYPNDPDVTETVTSFLWDGPDLSDYGARIEAWVYAPATGDYTFWLACDDQGELWLSTDDDPSNAEMIAYVKDPPPAIGGWTDLNQWTKYDSQKSEPVSLVAGEKYYIMAIWKEGSGGDHCHVAWEGTGIPTRTTIPGNNLSPFEPLNAIGAKPANRATGVTQTPTLRWKAGLQAESHEVYFGTDEAAVANATKASPEYKGDKALGDESFDPGKLPWESTFFWRVDEVNNLNPDSPWIGAVWSFTTADFLIVDDFEEYTDNDAAGEAIWQHWIDGFGVNTNGSQVGYVLPPYAEQTVVHGGRQSMPLSYNNTADITNSEAEKALTATRDWTEEGVGELSIWFQGQPGSVGSFVEGPVGTYTMTGSGADIWNVNGVEADEFHFAYKMLTGPGTIIARVESVDNTNSWAKAGVMIRNTLDPDSAHAFACVTPENGVASQGRPDVGGVSFNTAQGGITAPHWVKLERDLSGNFTVSHSANGSAWEPVQGAMPVNIQMNSTVYAGLAVTAHDAALTCEAVFSNVTITGNAAGQWTNQDIGIAGNAAEPLYVTVSNATGAPVVVPHDDPAAAQIDTWTEWTIDLSTFSDQGINLSDVDKIAIGLGSKGGAAAGGSGVVFVDDIRLLRPAPQP